MTFYYFNSSNYGYENKEKTNDHIVHASPPFFCYVRMSPYLSEYLENRCKI